MKTEIEIKDLSKVQNEKLIGLNDELEKRRENIISSTNNLNRQRYNLKSSEERFDTIFEFFKKKQNEIEDFLYEVSKTKEYNNFETERK